MQDNNPYKSPAGSAYRKPDKVALASDGTPEKRSVRIMAVLLGLFVYWAGSVALGSETGLLSLSNATVGYAVGTLLLYIGLTGRTPKFLR